MTTQEKRLPKGIWSECWHICYSLRDSCPCVASSKGWGLPAPLPRKLRNHWVAVWDTHVEVSPMSMWRGSLRAPGHKGVWRGLLAAISGLCLLPFIRSPWEHLVLRLKPEHHLPCWSFCAGSLALKDKASTSDFYAVWHIKICWWTMLEVPWAPAIWNQSCLKHMIRIILLQKYFLFPAQSSCTNTCNEVRTNKQLEFAKVFFLSSNSHSYFLYSVIL